MDLLRDLESRCVLMLKYDIAFTYFIVRLARPGIWIADKLRLVMTDSSLDES